MRAWSSLLAVGGCLVAFGAAAWRAPAAFRQLDDNGAVYIHESPLKRSLRPAYGTGIDPTFLIRARTLIPPTATYTVIRGDGAKDATANTLAAVAPFAGYWLLPRRQLTSPDQGVPDWVLDYGGDLASLHYRYARVVRVGAGLELAQVRR